MPPCFARLLRAALLLTPLLTPLLSFHQAGCRFEGRESATTNLRSF